MPAVPPRTRPHRLYLYLLHPLGQPGEFEWLASANGFLPSLWQILLADAQPRPQLQRVLLSDAESWTAVDATVALTRFDSFRRLVLLHPAIDRVAGLDRYLAAAQQFFGESIAKWQRGQATPPMLCVNLALLPALDPAHSTPRDYPAELHQFRDSFDRLLTDRNVAAIADVMGFPQRNLGFEDWKSWSGMFGLAQLEPHYFSGAFRRPFDGDYADHDYDELGSDPDLGGGYRRFKSGNTWGIDSERGRVLDARWDRILRSGDASLVWVRREERFGLARLADGRLLTPVEFDEVHAFVAGLARVRVGKQLGLLRTDGSWLLQPSMEEIHAFAQDFAVIRVHGKYGYLDNTGAIAIAPRFDEADDFTAAGVARVRAGACCGLIRRDGNFALPLRYASIEWSRDFAGWQCKLDASTWRLEAEDREQAPDGASPPGSQWLMRADGSSWIDSRWDEIEVFAATQLIRVRRGILYGLLRWDGSELLPCEFQELTQLDRSRDIVARRDGLMGLFGPDGATLIPFEYAAIEASEPHTEGEHRLETPDLVRVMSPPGKAAPRFGMWSLAQRRCIVPCAHDYLWTVLLGVGDDYGFIAGNRNPKRGTGAKGRYRVGILNSDGSVLIPQDYAWIGESTPLNRPDARIDIRNTLYHYWSRGESVRASINEHGPIVGLPPGTLVAAKR